MWIVENGVGYRGGGPWGDLRNDKVNDETVGGRHVIIQRTNT